MADYKAILNEGNAAHSEECAHHSTNLPAEEEEDDEERFYDTLDADELHALRDLSPVTEIEIQPARDETPDAGAVMQPTENDMAVTEENDPVNQDDNFIHIE